MRRLRHFRAFPPERTMTPITLRILSSFCVINEVYLPLAKSHTNTPMSEEAMYIPDPPSQDMSSTYLEDG